MKRLSVLIGLMVALFFSCSVEVEETAVSENLKVKAQLQLSVNSLLGGDVPGTRAIAGLEETAINNLTVLQFDANEKLVYKEYLSSTTLNIVDGKLSNELDLDAGTSTIWFVANTAETDIHDKLTVNTSTLENFKALSFKLATGTDVVVENGMAYDSTYLRASGYWKGDVPGSDNFISATLYPLAAKLTVNYEIVNGEGSINNIQVWNVPLQMAYSTTPDNNVITTAETTAYNVCSLQDEQTDDTNTNTQGSVSFYVTENITNIESDNTEPGRKNDSASGHNPIFIKLDGTYKSGDTDVPFTINLYPGADNCKDFNVKINHNYQVNLMLDISNIEKWVDDKRISTKFDLPYQDKLVVRYEFDTKNKAYNSMYSKEQKALFGTDGTVSGANDTDTTNTQNGVSVKITTGNLIRNLAGNGDTYCTLRG